MYMRNSILTAVALLMLLFPVHSSAAQQREGKIKAAVVYYLAKFVTFPKTAFADDNASLILCVLGEDPLNAYIDDTVKGKQIDHHDVTVKLSPNVRELRACNVVVLGQLSTFDYTRALSLTDRLGVLTISAVNGEREGSIFYLLKGSNKVRLKVDLAAAKHAELRISSELLAVAEIISRS